MKIVERAKLDVNKWDALVERSGGTVFSCSYYLDAVAENWCALVDDAYSAGMALPYTLRAGQKTLYTPVFVRYLEWFGPAFSELEGGLKKQFQRADLCLRTPIFGQGEELIYQQIGPETVWKSNELAGRMLKKFAKSDIELLTDRKTDDILTLVRTELSLKVGSLDEKAIHRLKRLTDALDQQGVLRTVTASMDNEFLGGAFFIDFGDRLIYLKSAFRDKAKRSGVMYAVMHERIETILTDNRIFDFGGSRVPTVRQFNSNLGGKDVSYYHFRWDHSPFWFKMLLKLRKLLKGHKSNSAQKM